MRRRRLLSAPVHEIWGSLLVWSDAGRTLSRCVGSLLTRHIFGLLYSNFDLTPFRAAIKVWQSARFPRCVRVCSPCFISSQYLSVAVGTILLYDYLLTFGDEVCLHSSVPAALLAASYNSPRCNFCGAGRERDGVSYHCLEIHKREH